ncbi:Calmodulin-3 [Porphyridium purpureum]|uniref:Calmodulin-3 n=1 Tax=Porphyridium purpureum TaxID=35688 RepID=A0A5J4Z8L3_PORPP|nr:Calmodulin-3 [Porphyridium purpureum]|eukprot:POR1660..scf295_1
MHEIEAGDIKHPRSRLGSILWKPWGPVHCVIVSSPEHAAGHFHASSLTYKGAGTPPCPSLGSLLSSLKSARLKRAALLYTSPLPLSSLAGLRSLVPSLEAFAQATGSKASPQLHDCGEDVCLSLPPLSIVQASQLRTFQRLISFSWQTAYAVGCVVTCSESAVMDPREALEEGADDIVPSDSTPNTVELSPHLSPDAAALQKQNEPGAHVLRRVDFDVKPKEEALEHSGMANTSQSHAGNSSSAVAGSSAGGKGVGGSKGGIHGRPATKRFEFKSNPSKKRYEVAEAMPRARRAAFSDSRIEWYRKMFDLHAKDGVISKRKLERLLAELNEPAWLMDSLIQRVDPERSNSITFDDFLEMLAYGQLSQHEDLAEAFKVFDLDNSGELSMDEWKYILCDLGEGMTEEEAEEVFRIIDSDSSGAISVAEFIRVVEACLNETG